MPRRAAGGVVTNEAADRLRAILRSVQPDEEYSVDEALAIERRAGQKEGYCRHGNCNECEAEWAKAYLDAEAQQ